MMAQKDDTEKPDFEALYGEDERNLNRTTQEELGITNITLATQLKEALEAEEPRIIKVKGAVKQADLPDGFEIIAVSGMTYHDKKGNEFYGDGETIIRYKVALQGIREGARKDAHAQRGHYPADKHEHSGFLKIIPQLTTEDRELIAKATEKVIDAISGKHRATIKSRG